MKKTIKFKDKEYKPILEYPSYGITSDGLIINRKTGKLMKGSLSHGYPRFPLMHHGKIKIFRISRLVAEAWIPNPDNKPYVCHKDNNPENNHIDNLYWGTQQENIEQASKEARLGRKKPIKQLSMEGEFIKTWESPKEASLELLINNRNICAAARGLRNSAGGYKWEYVN